MARANKNTLHHSRIEMDRQQRQEQPDVPGATGAPEDDSVKAAQERALKRLGKTEKHVSGESPAPAEPVD